MMGRNRIWIVLLLAGLILSFVHADAQQESQRALRTRTSRGPRATTRGHAG
jgi:hypothetical protein